MLYGVGRELRDEQDSYLDSVVAGQGLPGESTNLSDLLLFGPEGLIPEDRRERDRLRHQSGAQNVNLLSAWVHHLSPFLTASWVRLPATEPSDMLTVSSRAH